MSIDKLSLRVCHCIAAPITTIDLIALPTNCVQLTKCPGEIGLMAADFVVTTFTGTFKMHYIAKINLFYT